MFRLEGPVRVTATSRPFRSALNKDSSLYVDLDALAYVEEEWFVHGTADAVDPDGGVLAALAPFRTRLLVRRPASPTSSSGALFIEPLHNILEDTPGWTAMYRHLARRGHTWIGVTVNNGSFAPAGDPRAGGVAYLQAQDPERYGRLHLEVFDRPPPTPAPIGPGGFDPEDMRWRMGIAAPQGHHIMRQLVEALHAGQATTEGFLTTDKIQRLYATGWSQTGFFWQQFLEHGNHELTCRPDGRSAIDAYLICVLPGQIHKPADTIVVQLLSEAEVVGTLRLPNRVDDDSDAPPYRGYEVPGTFHFWQEKPTAPPPSRGGSEHSGPHNGRPWDVVIHAVIENLERWLRDGVPLPRAERIVRDPAAADGVARDAHGNARGGLRSPWVDVPTARYLARCVCSPVIGAMVPFDAATMHRLYPTGDALARSWRDALVALVAQRWLLAEDAAELKEAEL